MRRTHARTVVSVVSAVILGATALGAAAAGPAPAVLSGAPGISVAGGAHVVTAPSASGSTQVRLVRDRDGAVIRSRTLPGRLGVPMITFSGLVEGTWSKGRRLVLATSIYDDPSHTTFVTIDTRTLAPLRTIRLPGSFAFDAVSPDGRRLYVLQYPGGVQGGVRYVVRSLSLATGRLDTGAIVDRTEPDEQMSGIALARVWSGNGAWAYTLYNGGDSHAFVHALNTRTRTARCIDLPWKGAEQNGLETTLMSVSRAGSLTLTQPLAGVLARIDTRTFRVDVLRAPVTS